MQGKNDHFQNQYHWVRGVKSTINWRLFILCYIWILKVNSRQSVQYKIDSNHWFQSKLYFSEKWLSCYQNLTLSYRWEFSLTLKQLFMLICLNFKMFTLILTITSITLFMAYEFILKKMYGSEKLRECLNFNLHEMNSIKLKYHLQMRALIHDYNSFW